MYKLTPVLKCLGIMICVEPHVENLGAYATSTVWLLAASCAAQMKMNISLPSKAICHDILIQRKNEDATLS